MRKSGLWGSRSGRGFSLYIVGFQSSILEYPGEGIYIHISLITPNIGLAVTVSIKERKQGRF